MSAELMVVHCSASRRSEVGGVDLQMPPKISKGHIDVNLVHKNNIKFWTTFFAISALDTAFLRIETSHRQTKSYVNLKCVP